jgi:hypothetical protein
MRGMIGDIVSIKKLYSHDTATHGTNLSVLSGAVVVPTLTNSYKAQAILPQNWSSDSRAFIVQTVCF